MNRKFLFLLLVIILLVTGCGKKRTGIPRRTG